MNGCRPSFAVAAGPRATGVFVGAPLDGAQGHPRGTRPQRSARGFTLIEVLLALALLAALLAALNQFVFAITEAWVKDRDRFVFTQHARAVTRHIDELLQTASNSARASGSTTGAPAVDELRVPGGTPTDLLAFDLPNGDRLFNWPSRPLPEVRCGLGVRPDEGLVIYWKSRLEQDFATADMRMTVISPFVTAVSYDYYDTEKKLWSTEEKLQEDATGNYQTPRRVRLKFARNGQEIEQIIPLAVNQEGLPAY
jgi:prepilin-type N-terminal cleavage/methylation domain-containing protein